MSKKAEPDYRKGALSDEEKRKIEQMIQFDTYAEIGRKLNRKPVTVRMYCQRKGLTKDIKSVERHVENRVKRSPYFEELSHVLTESEMDTAVKIYTDLMKQFGTDILPSEEIQVIDFCIVSALLKRALAREKEIGELLKKQIKLRDSLEKEKERIDSDDDEGRENWYDKIEQVDLRIGSLSDELKEVKKNQTTFIDKKERATRSMNASRDQRADEIAKMNENWADLMVYLKTHPDFRKHLGYEMEKFRIGIKEEYIRLSALHEFADGEFDNPILNSEIVEMMGGD